jgi:MoxR-like ATPase
VNTDDIAFAYLIERLTECFPELDTVSLRQATALRQAFEEALVSMDADTFVARLVKRGPLRDAVNPYGVLVWRARRIVADVDERTRLAVDAADRHRAHQLSAAASFGERLADLLVAGELDREGAERRVFASYPDPDVAAVAFAALGGGGSS